MPVGMTGCGMTGRRRRTGTASVLYCYKFYFTPSIAAISQKLNLSEAILNTRKMEKCIVFVLLYP